MAGRHCNLDVDCDGHMKVIFLDQFYTLGLGSVQGGPMIRDCATLSHKGVIPHLRVVIPHLVTSYHMGVIPHLIQMYRIILNNTP